MSGKNRKTSDQGGQLPAGGVPVKAQEQGQVAGSTALTPAPKISAGMLAPLGLDGDKVERIATSLPTVTQADKDFILACLQGDEIKGATMLGKRFKVCDFLMHDVEMTDDETGEIQDGVRTVLIGPEGQRYAFVSRGVIKSLRRIAALGAPPPWRPFIMVELSIIPGCGEKKPYRLDKVLQNV